jgi:hypothetical protein
MLIRFKALMSLSVGEREREGEVQRDRYRERKTDRQTEREWEVKSLNSKLNMFLQVAWGKKKKKMMMMMKCSVL